MATIKGYRIVKRGIDSLIGYVPQAYVSDYTSLDEDTFKWRDILMYSKKECFAPYTFSTEEDAMRILNYIINGTVKVYFDEEVYTHMLDNACEYYENENDIII